jgi:hypothetical protein
MCQLKSLKDLQDEIIRQDVHNHDGYVVRIITYIFLFFQSN